MTIFKRLELEDAKRRYYSSVVKLDINILFVVY